MSELNINLASSSVCEASSTILPAQNQDIGNNTNSVPVVNDIPEYDRQKLKELVSLHLKELLFKEVLKNNLENEIKIKGNISINFLNESQNPKAIPERSITLQMLPFASAIDKVINLILANKNYNSYILPFVSNNGSAEQSSVIGGESLIIDLDKGNIDEKLKLITETFGIPSVVLKSGSIVDGKYSCRHVYYKFNEYLTGDKFKKLLDIRGKIAAGFGGDLAYQRNPAQLVRIFGTYNHKQNAKCFSEIEQNNLDSALYNFDDFCVKADSYFTETTIMEVREKASKSAINSEDVSIMDFPIHQPPLELNDGQVLDYLNALIPDVFEKGNYELWLKALFATHHQYNGSDKGKELFTTFSLQDKDRKEKEIRDSINEHWKYSKTEKSNRNVITFKTIIDIVNNKSFIDEELSKNPHLGKVIKIFNDNPLYDEIYVLTENYLCIKVKLKGKNAPPPYLQPICNYLKVLGGGNGSKGNSYRLIEYLDTNNKLVENLLAVSLRGQELQTYLADINLQFNSKYYSLIQNYLLNSQASSNKINIIHKTGWNEDQTCYSLVYRDKIKTYYCDKQSEVKKVYLEFGTSPDEYLRKKGSLDSWKEITRLAKGNDNIIFALGLPFASMWLTPLEYDSRIIHFFGQSQNGKSSLLSIASSVLGISVGNEDYTHWYNTANSIENLCKIRNDSLLIQDELHKLKIKKDLPDIPYKVAGGMGAIRMSYNTTTNNNRTITTWKVLLLSSGENSYQDELVTYGLSDHYKGGMMNRWADFPVVTEEYGVFTIIHEFLANYPTKKEASDAFRKHVVSVARKNKGQAICAYLEYVFETKCFDDVFIEIKSLVEKWLQQYFYNNNPKININNYSQEMSVARIFALSAAALKIAADANIVDYSQDYIFDVFGRCFNKFLANKVDVEMSAEDRILKKTLINFLNNELHKGFFDKDSHSVSSNINYNNIYGLKEQMSKYGNESSKYDYYVEVGKWDLIFKGKTTTLVKRFLRNNEFITPDPNKTKGDKIEYSFNKHNRLIGRSCNYNKLDLVKIGFVLPDNTDLDIPTDKLKELPKEQEEVVEKY